MTGHENDETSYLLSSKTNAARLRESVNQLAERTTKDLLVEIEQRATSNDDDFRKLLELWQKLLGERHPQRAPSAIGLTERTNIAHVLSTIIREKRGVSTVPALVSEVFTHLGDEDLKEATEIIIEYLDLIKNQDSQHLAHSVE